MGTVRPAQPSALTAWDGDSESTVITSTPCRTDRWAVSPVLSTSRSSSAGATLSNLCSPARAASAKNLQPSLYWSVAESRSTKPLSASVFSVRDTWLFSRPIRSAIRTTPKPPPSTASSPPRTVKMASSRLRFVSFIPTTRISITYTKLTRNYSCCIHIPPRPCRHGDLCRGYDFVQQRRLRFHAQQYNVCAPSARDENVIGRFLERRSHQVPFYLEQFAERVSLRGIEVSGIRPQASAVISLKPVTCSLFPRAGSSISRAALARAARRPVRLAVARYEAHGLLAGALVLGVDAPHGAGNG